MNSLVNHSKSAVVMNSLVNHSKSAVVMNSLVNHSKAAEAAMPQRTKKAHRPKVNEAVESPDKMMADKFRRLDEVRALKAKTTLGLYSLKTKDGKLYGVPFCAVSDHYALLAQKQVSPMTDCFRLGSVCLYNGTVVAENKPVLILDKGV